MQVQPYLVFEGRCEEAIEFYRKAVGAELIMQMKFKDMPGPHPPGAIPPGTENKVMHASLRIGDSIVLCSDGRCDEPMNFKGIMLALQVKDEATADRLFAGLTDGGQVTMPLGKTFWSPRFGMLIDRFGVSWMVNLETAEGS